MPLGWECRAKFIKQLPPKTTEHRGTLSGETQAPGPNEYTTPQIFCGKGYSKIKRSPAYTFGHLTKPDFSKPVTTPYAPMFNVRGKDERGPFRITTSVVTPRLKPPQDKLKVPGPGAYAPRLSVSYKRPPAYSLRSSAAPAYQAWDQWTPPPNMYNPPIPCKKPPAYTLGYTVRTLKTQDLPGPGEHEPNFDYVKRNKPAYSFGSPFRRLKPPKTPPPNTYCEKKFMVTKRASPAPSFGIHHTPFLGQRAVYLRPSKLDLEGISAIE